VVEGETGILVPAGDVESLAAGLATMSADPQRATKLGRAGRTRVEQRFSLPAMVAAYQALYDRLLTP